MCASYPGTEFYDFAAENGFIVNNGAMVDDGGKAVALNMAALSG